MKIFYLHLATAVLLWSQPISSSTSFLSDGCWSSCMCGLLGVVVGLFPVLFGISKSNCNAMFWYCLMTICDIWCYKYNIINTYIVRILIIYCCAQKEKKKIELLKDTYMTNCNIKTKMEKVPVIDYTKTRYIGTLGSC